MRTRTKRRMFRKLHLHAVNFKAGKGSEISVESSLQSYLGVFSHADTHKLTERLKNQYWFWMHD
ncbi:hypothetical protein HYS30_00625 [Candidatus Peregrinibacteria bacterium]|nr:hypothetical protein [Candidatus Peregrinibacteria bacterium]MBI2523807.1 hypothetical protein [Candidatus Peregrinibacteria bacterium]